MAGRVICDPAGAICSRRRTPRSSSSTISQETVADVVEIVLTERLLKA
jgi:hypothetical protein